MGEKEQEKEMGYFSRHYIHMEKSWPGVSSVKMNYKCTLQVRQSLQDLIASQFNL